MIVRIWHGATDASKADDYLEFLNKRALPDYRNTKGNLGAYVVRHLDDDKAHFMTFTFWDSFDAVKRFAGTAYDRARYYPEDKDYLVEFEPTVQHYDFRMD